MGWALLGVTVFFLIIAYIVIQGTRAAMAWRKAAAAGDVETIRRIVEDAIGAWRSSRRPKEVPPNVWRGIQGMEAVDIGPDFARVSCQAEGEYRMLDGRWVEISNPLQEGMAITAKAADVLLYELPHVSLDRVQVDVYTTFRETGAGRRECILSTTAGREVARRLDWENWTAADIVEAFGGRYRIGPSGQPLPIETEPVRPQPAGNGATTPSGR